MTRGRHRGRRATVTADLAARIAFLRRPDSYPPPTARVEAVETHMSWVFLTECEAYKLKKPVRRNGIDHRTPAHRERGCRRELQLNRRLAPDVYLDVVPLTIDARGQLSLGGRGRRIDSLVRMRRLPAQLTLEHALASGGAGADEARRIVARLLPFFAAAPRIRIAQATYRRELRDQISVAASTLRRPGNGLQRAVVDTVAAALRRFITRRGDLLDARVQAGRLVEGHGDLRPEHIYLTDPPSIIDCIEFDRRLRRLDPVYELAFLAMECDRAGEPAFDQWLFSAYRQATRDEPPRALIDFYKAHNAFRRARIAIWHLDDPDTGPRERWISRAEDYLRLGRGYLAASPGTVP